MRLNTFPGGWGSADEIAGVQERLLREHLSHCKKSSPFYRGILSGFAVENFTPGSLAELPLTDKAEFSGRGADFLAVSPDKIVDIVLSSGTTGTPSTVMYSEHDLRRLAYSEAVSLAGCGITKKDTALLTCTMDRCFVAGLAYQSGLRKIGAAVIRSGASTLASQCDLICRLSPTVLVGVPSFLRKLGRFLGERGLEPAASSVRCLVCIGEPLRDANLSPLRLAEDLESLWNARAFSTYATTETASAFCECAARGGGHLNPELAVVEIVGADGRRLPPGEHGEVVMTPLQCEAMPLVRFRTGDISFLIEGPCSCGRITPRLGPILGRRGQMIKTKGTTVYPLSILAALDDIPGISDYCVIVTSEDRLSDHMTVHASVSSGHELTPEFISEQLQSRLRVKADVVIKPEPEITREIFSSESRKAVRFVDRRNVS